MFAYADIDYVDRRLSWEEWLEIKAAQEFGKGTQLPVLIDRETKVLKN